MIFRIPIKLKGLSRMETKLNTGKKSRAFIHGIKLNISIRKPVIVPK
jgi:hypothetical protein